jgi:Protein of unknown function (DUF1631)
MDEQFTTTQRTQLVDQVRAGYAFELSRALVDLAGVVNTRLTTLMNESGTLRERQTKRDFWTQYQSARAAWLEATQKAWQSALKPETQSKPKTQLTLSDLTLVGTDQVENNILASRLARAAKEKIGTPIEDLFLRVQFLMGGKLDDQDLLNPEVPIGLMLDAWANCGMSLFVWPLMSEVVTRHLSEQFAVIYTRCNEQLIQLKVMPVIEPSHRFNYVPVASTSASKSNTEAASRVARSAAQPTRSELDVQGGGSADSTGARRKQETSLIEQIHRLLSSHSSPTPKTRPMRFRPTAPALLEAVAQESQHMLAYAHHEVASGKFGQEGVARFATQLREKSAEIKKKAETSTEKATIEIVALMFQSILAETRISPAIRVWFARLQMPVLRLSLTDPDLVGTLDHPARQLIDRMGSCAMGFDAADVSALALETEIKRVVQVIEQYPETGKQVFKLMLNEFQVFLTQFLAGKGVSERLRTVAQQVEHKETLTIQYTIEIRKLLQDMQVGDAIRRFLFKVWAEALAVAAVRQGPQHAQTVVFKKTAVDLVRLAGAKGKRLDRARAMQQLPPLLKSLREGMSLLGLPLPEQEEHIKMVSNTLADAFLSKAQAIPKARLDQLAAQLAQLENFVSDSGDEDIQLSAQTIEKMLGMDASTVEVVINGGVKATPEMMKWTQSLLTGAWFTLNHNGHTHQVQFIWCSDHKHLYLFSRADAHCFMIQSKRLAAYLQVGLLVPLEEESLTVRATRDALSQLEANPDRLMT